MVEEALIEETVIKTYMELYLTAIKENKPDEEVDRIHSRMVELLERKKQRSKLI
tara:strand:+ start:313 stop:474 length:162 start_codon:yes stop_codon:yes gene_type:complete